MGESLVQVTEGSGKKLHTWQRTVGANSVEDEIVLPGLPAFATYSVPILNVSLATANSHILQLMAGASLNVYVVRIRLWQSAAATTAAFASILLHRLTTAGTGGGVQTPAAHDPADAAAGAVGMTLPTVKGTESTAPLRFMAYLTQTPGAAGSQMLPIIDWEADKAGLVKPMKIAAGTTNGLVIKNETAVAAASVTGYLTFIEASYS